MAVVLVSPAPLSPPATMNWELWNGCKKATDQHDVPADPYDLRIAVVETNDIAAEQDKYGGQDQGEQKADGPGAARVGLGHIVAAFSQRLPHKGRGRNGQTPVLS